MTLSRTIEQKRNHYYDALQSAQRGNEVTAWVAWFASAVADAQRDAEAQIRFVLRKARFFRNFGDALGARQMKVMRRMFDAGAEGFAGGMNARKYVALTGVSKATATRDLQDLVQKGALTRTGERKHTRYRLKLDSLPT